MEFRAPTVYHKKNPKARISGLGAVLLVAAVILTFMDGYEKLALWTFGAAILIFFAGVIAAKGDLTDIAVSHTIQLMMSTGGIGIGETFYPMSQVSNIAFDIKGYAGMHTSSLVIVGAESDGMGNYLRFEHAGRRVECRFYLGGPPHVQLLAMLFQALHDQHIGLEENLTKL